MQRDSEGLNFEQALRTLRRRAPLIVLCCVLAAGAAYGVSKHQTKKYTATASLVFGNSPLSQQIVGLSASGGSGSLTQQTSNVELVRGGDTAAKTASLLGRGLTEEAVSESVSVAGQGESNVVNLSATATSPVLAANIANTYASQFVREQRRANGQYFRSALALVNKQLAKLTPAQRLGQDGLSLEDRAQTLSLLKELHYNDVQVSQEALPPTSPVLAKDIEEYGPWRAAGAAHRAWSRLCARWSRPPDQGTGGSGGDLSPPLARGSAREHGACALPAAWWRREGTLLTRGGRGVQPDPCSSALLQYRSRATHNRVASPAPGDGKTTIARDLAEAAARLGSRVLLVEADLRHPTLARQLDIQPGPGLADVLIGALAMGEATQSVPWRRRPERGSRGGCWMCWPPARCCLPIRAS